MAAERVQLETGLVPCVSWLPRYDPALALTLLLCHHVRPESNYLAVRVVRGFCDEHYVGGEKNQPYAGD